MGTTDDVRHEMDGGGWIRALRSGLKSFCETDEARHEAERLLVNWGRWCRDDWWRRLGYAILPTSRDYRAPRSELRRWMPPIVADDAWMANEAILRIGVREPPKTGLHPFTMFEFIKLAYAFHRTDESMAKHFNCTTRTIRRWRVQTRQEFWQEYREVRREQKEVA